MQIVTAPPVPGIVTAVEVGLSITTSKYHPIRKQPAFTPLAPSVTCGDSSLPEGAIFSGLLLFHTVFLQFERACCKCFLQQALIFYT